MTGGMIMGKISDLISRTTVITGVLWIWGSGLLVHANEAQPFQESWWPSEWGEADERGAANRMTSARTLEATALIREGKVVQLGRVYEPGMPLFGNRHFSLTIISSPTGGPLGKNQAVWHDEMFSGEIGQIGTQLDGLGHIGVRKNGEDIFYNGINRTEMKGAYGLEKLGVENAGVFFTRGVLLDVAATRDVEWLDPGYLITVKDIEKTLERQNLKIRQGDAVLIHTGHGRLWMKDNDTYNSGEPGLGIAAAKWIAARKVVLIGADSWAVEAIPGEDPDIAFPVHRLMLVENGIYLLENLDLSSLVKNKIHEFAFIFAPLRLKGATGSPGNPVAVY
jgi:kynurenine formamidase